MRVGFGGFREAAECLVGARQQNPPRSVIGSLLELLRQTVDHGDDLLLRDIMTSGDVSDRRRSGIAEALIQQECSHRNDRCQRDRY